MHLITGIESTRFLAWPGQEEPQDVMDVTGHKERFREDFWLLRRAGVTDLRYPVLWHHIQPDPTLPEEAWNWKWQDEALHELASLGISPILDPCHHVNIPDWLKGGFANPEFPYYYARFVRAAQRRYPWVRRWTLFNEPLATVLYCGHEGVWYPRGHHPLAFVPMCLAVAKAICLASATLLRQDPSLELFYNDTCEAHQLAPPPYQLAAETEGFTGFMNERRFLILDLALGRVGTGHPLLPYLEEHGCTAEQLAWLRAHPARIDHLCLDYYPAHEHQYHGSGDLSLTPDLTPRGLADIAYHDYYLRYQDVVKGWMVGETNLIGTDPDKVSWLRYVGLECEKLQRMGCPLWGLCWFGWTDTRGWGSLMRSLTAGFEGVGVVWIDPATLERRHGLFYELFGQLARREIGFADLPAFRFQPPVDRQLGGFLRGPMASWEWVEPPAEYLTTTPPVGSVSCRRPASPQYATFPEVAERLP